MVIIALDAGHGFYTSGKRCMKSIDPKETREWYLNDRISDKVEKILEDYDCKLVRVGDTTGSRDISLGQRVRTANNINADVYISVHHNAGIRGGSGGGTVVYYCSSKEERKRQAQSFYDEVVKQTNLIGNRSSKVLKRHFYVVANTKMPAFLIENGFMDSRTDTPIILTEEHANKTAIGIVNFLVKEFGIERKQNSKPVETPKETPNETTEKPTYKVQVGAFKKRDNAVALLKKLKDAGFNGIITTK